MHDHLPDAISRLLMPSELWTYDASLHVAVPTTTNHKQRHHNSNINYSDRHRNQEELSRQERDYDNNGSSRVRLSRTFHFSASEASCCRAFRHRLYKNEVLWPGKQKWQHEENVLERLEWYKHWRSASPSTQQLVVHLSRLIHLGQGNHFNTHEVRFWKTFWRWIENVIETKVIFLRSTSLDINKKGWDDNTCVPYKRLDSIVLSSLLSSSPIRSIPLTNFKRNMTPLQPHAVFLTLQPSLGLQSIATYGGRP